MAKAMEEQPPTPAAAEEPRPAAAEAVADDDGDSDDDGMSTWTPEEIADFNKVCVRVGLGIRYTS
jgi:hypothetical protein